MNTTEFMSTLSLIFLGISLVFFLITGITRDFLGIQRVKKYYYAGAVFMGLALFLLLTLENKLSVEAFIIPISLIALMIIFFNVHMFMQKKAGELVGEVNPLSLISRIRNFLNLIMKRK